MNIKEFRDNLQNLYREMSETFSRYQRSLGWNCVAGCGKCCLNPEIEASVLEMIPMAVSLYHEGKLEAWLEKLSTTEREYCLAYEFQENPEKGKCSRYEDRPSVCRMFAVAGFYNKEEKVTLSVCRTIRDEHEINEIPVGLNSQEVPLLRDWTYKLSSLHPELIQNRKPLNQALKLALEKVALYSQYGAL